MISIQSKHFTLRYDQSIYVVSLNLNLYPAFITIISCLFVFGLVGSLVLGDVRGVVLQDDETELLIGRNHDFIHRRADFDEGNLLFGVQGLDRHLRLVTELRDQ